MVKRYFILIQYKVETVFANNGSGVNTGTISIVSDNLSFISGLFTDGIMACELK